MRSQDLTTLERVILGEIRQRRESNPVSYRDLAEWLKVNPRRVRITVADLVAVHHQPILSSYDSKTPGYFWPDNREEMRRHLGRMLRHGVNIIRRVKTIGKYSEEEVLGQLRMELGSGGEEE